MTELARATLIFKKLSAHPTMLHKPRRVHVNSIQPYELRGGGLKNVRNFYNFVACLVSLSVLTVKH